MGKQFSQEEIENYLITQLSQQLGISADAIDIREPFARYGLDSVESVTFTAELGEWLGESLASTLLWDYPTIEGLAKHLAGQS